MRITRIFAIAACAIAGQGCTTYLYKGPTRPSAEVAVVTSNDTVVDSVDGVRVREYASGSYAHLELLPGPHLLTISLNRVTPGLFVTHVARSGDVGLCVQLEAGHAYQTEPALQGPYYAPVVIDLTAGHYAHRCGPPRTVPFIAQQPPVAPPRPAAGQPVAGTSSDGADSSTEPGAATKEAVTDQPVGGDASASVTAPNPPAPAVARTDKEEPNPVSAPRGRWHARERLPSDAVLANRRPGNGLSVTTGIAFGGEDFVQATDSNGGSDSLSSGSGVILGIGAMVTPLWAGDVAGFGLGADASIKYDHLSASNGSASITRYPISLTAHVLLNVADGLHYIILKGGAVRDFGVNYSASGFADLDANVSGTWGPTGAVGYYKKSNDVFGWDILGFFALTNHVIGPDSVNANSFGISWGIHWLP